MKTIYSYTCKDYPGLEECPGHFYAETDDELWKHIELHASVAHKEDPATWPAEERALVKTLIKTEKAES